MPYSSGVQCLHHAELRTCSEQNLSSNKSWVFCERRRCDTLRKYDADREYKHRNNKSISHSSATTQGDTALVNSREALVVFDVRFGRSSGKVSFKGELSQSFREHRRLPIVIEGERRDMRPVDILTRVFNPNVADGVASYVQKFKFSEIDINDSIKDDYLHPDLAPSFGTLNKDSSEIMNESVKIMIIGTMLALKEHREKNGPMDWETLNSVLIYHIKVVARAESQ